MLKSGAMERALSHRTYTLFKETTNTNMFEQFMQINQLFFLKCET